MIMNYEHHCRPKSFRTVLLGLGDGTILHISPSGTAITFGRHCLLTGEIRVESRITSRKIRVGRCGTGAGFCPSSSVSP